MNAIVSDESIINKIKHILGEIVSYSSYFTGRLPRKSGLGRAPFDFSTMSRKLGLPVIFNSISDSQYPLNVDQSRFARIEAGGARRDARVASIWHDSIAFQQRRALSREASLAAERRSADRR
jgi:hypothetical protein